MFTADRSIVQPTSFRYVRRRRPARAAGLEAIDQRRYGGDHGFDAARDQITELFGGGRMHGAYLYGSVSRGTAVPGVSDLDLMLALHDEPTEADGADAKRIEDALDRAFAQVNGVGIGLCGTSTLLSDLERYDLGFFVACLCTPLVGEDLAERLPRYRPTSLLARETNGDLAPAAGLALPGGRRHHRR